MRKLGFLISALLLVGYLYAQEEGERSGREETQISYETKANLTVVYPDDYDEKKKYPVIFTLPPGPGTAQMVDVNLTAYWEEAAKERGYFVVTPQVLGPSLGESAKALIPKIFKWMDDNISYDKERVILTGASNGGVGAFLAVLSFPERFCAMIAMPGTLGNGEWDLSTLKDKPIWMMVGSQDEQWKQSMDRVAKVLEENGAKVRYDIMEGQGHRIEIESAKLFDWSDKIVSREE